ncbi:MAG TPA: DUF1508 domain-containing protein [Flavobacterium sp.]|jgi:hypothetical protein
MGAFVITKRFNGEYKFTFTSRKGKVIYTSSGYDSKEICEADIEVVKSEVASDSFVRLKAAGGKYFFRILIGERQVAVSRKYSTELRMKKGIDEILLYSYKAEVLDFSEDSFVFPD